jgi:hypothetical protein
MSNRPSNEQKIKERPMLAYERRQWMLTNYGIAIGVFRTRKEASDYAKDTGRDIRHHEVRPVLVSVERQS